MTAKVLYVFCAQVLLVQTISGYCTNGAWPTAIGAGEGFGWPAPGYGYEAPLMAASPCAGPAPFLGAYDLAAIPSSYGGGFSVTSMSPVPPHGLSVMSDNAIEGVLVVGGELPFLSTVGLEGALPTAGVGSISYGCGNGNVGMVSEDILPMAAGLGWPATGMNYGPVMGNGLGYGAPWTASIMDYGLGCGAVY
ncbi:chorion class B protein PC10-like [Battus philenor]|uniref:chorion class B protein PC10-like n=1 Tax=Battus philenor TaxID=42288 RepID=UPI0035CF6AFD